MHGACDVLPQSGSPVWSHQVLSIIVYLNFTNDDPNFSSSIVAQISFHIFDISCALARRLVIWALPCGCDEVPVSEALLQN